MRRYEIIPLPLDQIFVFVAQYDLFGDLAEVGGFRRLDAAVRGRVAERRAVEYEVVDAGLQVGAVGRLVLVVGVVEVDARRSFAYGPERHADRRKPRPGGLGHGACSCGVVVLEGLEVGEPAVTAGREGPGLFEDHFARRRFCADPVGQRCTVGRYRGRAVASVGRGVLALVLDEGVIVASDVDGVRRERHSEQNERIKT